MSRRRRSGASRRSAGWLTDRALRELAGPDPPRRLDHHRPTASTGWGVATGLPCEGDGGREAYSRWACSSSSSSLTRACASVRQSRSTGQARPRQAARERAQEALPGRFDARKSKQREAHVGPLPHLPPHLRHDALPPRPQRQAGAELARAPLAAFTLSVYVHLLADDLPDAHFLDDLTRSSSGATEAGENSGDTDVADAPESVAACF